MNLFRLGGILLALLVAVPTGVVTYRYGARTGYVVFVLLSLSFLLYGLIATRGL